MMKTMSLILILILLALSLLCVIKQWRIPSIILLLGATVLFCLRNWEGVFWLFVNLFR